MASRPVVLVVEPNPLMAELLRTMLRPLEVRTVDPEDVVRTARRRRPALIISELLLRGPDGLELCRTLREDERVADTPVLVLSVLDAREEALEAGADAFVLKPPERRRLFGEIRRLLDMG